VKSENCGEFRGFFEDVENFGGKVGWKRARPKTARKKEGARRAVPQHRQSGERNYWREGSALVLLKLDPATSENWYERACLEALEKCLAGATDYQDLRLKVMAALARVVERQCELEVRHEDWARFEEESVKRGYAWKRGDQVRWSPNVKRGKKQK
jgi:hypothetical protein